MKKQKFDTEKGISEKETTPNFPVILENLTQSLKILTEAINKINKESTETFVYNTLLIFVEYNKDDVNVNITVKEEALGFLPERSTFYENSWYVNNIISFPVINDIAKDLKIHFLYEYHENANESIISFLTQEKDKIDFNKYNAIIFLEKSYD